MFGLKDFFRYYMGKVVFRLKLIDQGDQAAVYYVTLALHGTPREIYIYFLKNKMYLLEKHVYFSQVSLIHLLK